ncbi:MULTISPECIES: ABC transporter substrate-binding protein [Phyllobacteriaceae]|jgi:iron(III) transport system substrate-binding protein|uniref:Iron ABC transporter n=1 Tax=Mesorhizobium hungaricum TaxID=1566387 RepID=A0A1C2DJL5_9HYPH|nr:MULTISPECIES: ABC transporter substrate-binding protein [Mesorhizobium]MBN9233387.1 ABC transporter substrate-binding protein [Mesorhizobium sp.]MDQ0331923.1 iron(III) transport system substrate-binding protein [Mesorhizobium sp. YL-MeA3-2017]OCX14969.1 iron ABC transporter [Mesorhizobium hungaricum]
MRFVVLVIAALLPAPAVAETTLFPALDGEAGARTLVVYSALDVPLAKGMIEGFRRANPSIAVRYEELLTGDIYSRIVEETNAGGKTADMAFSSAMDLQVKLANDGYAQESTLPMSARWPRWANWRNTAYALTFEPAVFVYHKPSFSDAPPPATRGQLVDYIEHNADTVQGRIATYDIERSGVGFMFMARDQEQFPDIWSIVRTMGKAGVKLYSKSSAILERIADGRAILGYNILGSYAADWAARNPDVGIVMPKDYTIVMSRIGLVPKAAGSPDLGRAFLAYFMSAEGQTIMARDLHIAAVNPDVSGENTANAIQATMGAQLRPVPVSPGLLVYLDQVKRNRLVERWNNALQGR